MAENYKKMKVAELKAELQKRGLPVSGNKDTLIKRLKESKNNDEENEPEESLDESKSEEDGSSVEPNEEEEELPEDISKMKVAELKVVLKKRGLPVSGTKAQLVERLQGNINGDAPPEKKKRKATEEAGGNSQKKKKETNEIDDFTQPHLDGNELKIITWNIVGFKSILKKGFEKYLDSENPDMLCLNETKIDSIPVDKFPGYYSYIYSAHKSGYSGVGLITKIKPLSIKMGIGIKDHDTEGRCITAEYDNFYLVATYIPNSGSKKDDNGWPQRLEYRMEWDNAFQAYIQELDKKKPIILCGDLNVAHNEIDLANPKGNRKNAGFTNQERESFGKFLDTGFVDVHRHFFPDKKGEYTFWSNRSPTARSNNTGWRLDYFIVSKRLLPKVTQSYLRRSVMGSDHCPIGIHLKKSVEEKDNKK